MTSTDVLLVAPCLHGADGVSLVSRQLVRALETLQLDVESWVLADVDRRDLADAPSSGPDYHARGRIDLVRHGLWSALRQPVERLFVTHLHLLPVVAGHLARQTPLAVYLHGVECWTRLGPLRESLLARADVLLANSSHTAAQFADANPRFAERIVHICPPATPDDIEATELPESPIVLVVGRLARQERYKGHDALLNVWPSIVSALPGAQLLFVGGGDDRARLEGRIRDEGLASSVRSLGLLPRAELREAYASCRVFALPSSGEGFGIVFLEAMAAGRPCLGSFGAAEDVIDAGRTGLLVPPGDERALEAALIELLTDVDRCRSMGRAGRFRAKGQFSHLAFSARLCRALGMEQPRIAVGC